MLIMSYMALLYLPLLDQPVFGMLCWNPHCYYPLVKPCSHPTGIHAGTRSRALLLLRSCSSGSCGDRRRHGCGAGDSVRTGSAAVRSGRLSFGHSCRARTGPLSWGTLLPGMSTFLSCLAFHNPGTKLSQGCRKEFRDYSAIGRATLG